MGDGDESMRNNPGPGKASKKEPLHYRPPEELEEGGGEFFLSLSHFGEEKKGGEGLAFILHLSVFLPDVICRRTSICPCR